MQRPFYSYLQNKRVANIKHKRFTLATKLANKIIFQQLH